MRGRELLAAAGLSAATLGVVMVLAPGLAADVGRGRPIIVVVGLLAAVQGVRAALERRGAEVETAETADPEIPPDLPTPGADFDERLASVSTYHPRTTARRQDIEERLTQAAVAVLTRREQCSEAVAREMLREGTWTDDPVAADFLSDGRRRSLLLREQLVALFQGRRFDRDARRTLAAIVAVEEGER